MAMRYYPGTEDTQVRQAFQPEKKDMSGWKT
jgi:hypothetical protein